MGQQYQLFFVQRFKGKVLFDVPMSEYTSLGIGGSADVMAFPKDEADLVDLLIFASTKNFPVLVIGRGTNILVREGGIRGIVVNMDEGFKDIDWTDDVKAIAGAGVTLSALLKECRQKNLSGLEFAVDIPGSVGGAVAMNAGAYGKEMKDVVEGVEFISFKGKKGFFSAQEAGFSYRCTKIPKDSIITRAHMKFEKKEARLIDENISELRKRRNSEGAVKYRSAGSIFKNPPGLFAGKLIEEAGLKGKIVGDAQVSDVHANYIVNRGHARASDVLSLMAIVRDSVYGEKGIVLEPEIKVVGEDR